MTSHCKILCFGEILWDIFHDDTGSHKVLGGAPSNLCYFFNALGEPATLVSQVGMDSLGDLAIETIESLKMPHIITRSKLPTGKVDIYITDNEPHYHFNIPAAWDSIPDSHALNQVTPDAKMIAFGSLAHRFLHNDHLQDYALSKALDDSFITLTKILDMNPTAQRFLDLNLRSPYYHDDRVRTLLNFADALKINEAEFEYLKTLLNIENYTMRDALFTLITELSLHFIILTLGEKGSIVMSEQDYSAISACKVKVVDTVGAGDGFSAGFISALNQGARFAQAHAFANQLSGYICTQKGAFVTIPNHFKTTLATFNKW